MVIDYKNDINELKNKCSEFLSYINIDKIKDEIIELEKKTEKTGFYIKL